MTHSLDEHRCRQAVESRTAHPDMPFFYGVRSTGTSGMRPEPTLPGRPATFPA